MLLSKMIKIPDSHSLLHSSMGDKLKEVVESQLAKDLGNYKVLKQSLSFDWSQSYGSGRNATFMDGTIQNFSRIIVFDDGGNLVADGCMDFICNRIFCIAYWDLVTTWRDGHILCEKKEQGIPFHIWKQLPAAMMAKYMPKKADVLR
ncbi:MAG TPA: hypothetical protein VEB86_05380 [Chryseosolibacter sp.]|nr:hypothetical protein [Chryseosolibacter sp.]